MSNVLIGIIGVILFIGLALAGALILGDDFRTASTSSQGTALMSKLKQAADAAEMRRVKLGISSIPSIETDFLVPRFLKTPAINPTHNARANPNSYRYKIEFNNDIYPESAGEPQWAAKYVQAAIGPSDDDRAAEICQSISESVGVPTMPTITDPEAAAGCVHAYGYFFAYVRVAPRTQALNTPSGYVG